MSPYETIRAKYMAEPEDLPFETYLFAHHLRGFVYSTPAFFAMGVPVLKSALEAGQHPLEISTAAPDCWYVSAFAGDMAQAWSILPFSLTWVSFDRGARDRKELRFYPAERIREHCLQ